MFLGTFEQAVQKSTSALNLSPIKYFTSLVHAFLMGLFFYLILAKIYISHFAYFELYLS